MNVVVRKVTEEEMLYMSKEAVWECGISEFTWHYDSDETCVVVNGQATVEYKGGSVSLCAGDLAFFPKGLDCVWKVSAPVKKYYR